MRTVCDPQENIYYLEQEIREAGITQEESSWHGRQWKTREHQEVLHEVTPQMVSKVEEMVTTQVKSMQQEVFLDINKKANKADVYPVVKEQQVRQANKLRMYRRITRELV